jgi:hypothetical protein
MCNMSAPVGLVSNQLIIYWQMILDGTFRKWGHWPYFQITDQNIEFLGKVLHKIINIFLWIGILSGQIYRVNKM